MSNRILVVDDDRLIREILRGGLEAQGFTVVPIVIMMAYIWFAKRMGAFEAH